MASIAKLAIQITTDTKQMSEGFRRAQNETKQLGNQLEASFSKALISQKTANVLFHAARSLLREMVDAAADFQDKLAKITAAPELDTLHGQLKRLHETLGLLLAGGADVATEGLKRFLQVVDRLNIALGRGKLSGVLDQLNEQQERAKKLEEQRKEALKKIAEQLQKEKRAQEEALKAQQRAFDEADRRAEEIRKAARTPQEVLRESLKELNEFLDQDLITLETFRRGAQALAGDFQKAQQAAEFKFVKPNVGAAEKGTTAEVSARVEAAHTAASLQRLHGEVQKTNRLLNQMLDEMKAPPVQFTKGAF